jgi:hypothetical protein
MKHRGKIFAGICVVSGLALAGYIYNAKSRFTSVGAPDSGAGEGDLGAHRIFFRYTGTDAHYGNLAHVGPGSAREPQFVKDISCEVVSVTAAGQGICLRAKRGVVTTYTARLFDTRTFTVHATIPLNGVPSRTRISADGTFAAVTVFISGHGYASVDFSTQTLLIDVPTGKVLADLETFAVTKEGKPFKEQDFNYWGVTFTRDGKRFYATLSSGGQHYLIEGDVEKRTANVLHSNVECPSLSPDATRVAYKKRLIVDNRVNWQLHVLDLASGRETPLAETRSVDDQLEWLDSEHVLYTIPEKTDQSTAGTDVWMAAADGSRPPLRFIHNAYSPSVER